ncbi:MAG: hypothetical protein LUE61_02090 [Clostridiales bacterium]|nr:hypothetical protein [Clostridiales bacterium]
MEQRIPLYERSPDGAAVQRGEVRCTGQGMYVRFQADCPAWSPRPEVCKVWLEQGERRLLLGTLMPEGDRLTLSRQRSVGELNRWGVPNPEQATVAGDEPPPRADRWQRLDALPLQIRDESLAEALRRAPAGGRWRAEGEGWLLRFPWQPGQAFPLPALFCFGRYREGALWFRLSGQGYPVSP